MEFPWAVRVFSVSGAADVILRKFKCQQLENLRKLKFFIIIKKMKDKKGMIC